MVTTTIRFSSRGVRKGSLTSRYGRIRVGAKFNLRAKHFCSLQLPSFRFSAIELNDRLNDWTFHECSSSSWRGISFRDSFEIHWKYNARDRDRHTRNCANNSAFNRTNFSVWSGTRVLRPSIALNDAVTSTLIVSRK